MRTFLSIVVASLLPPLMTAAAERRSAVVVAVERAAPAVVNVSTAEVVEREMSPFPGFRDPFFDQFFGDFFEPRRQRFTRTSLGSGAIIREDGYIVTNQHVVVRATKITATLVDQREFEVELVGSDADSDLAVLKLKKAGRLPAVPMGTSSDLMIGETVIAIGNPFGLSHTVTTGVVSAVGRSLRADQQTFTELIQTDASINPGNSGGPLLNIDGDMIGINTAIYQKAQGIGFAVPVDRARRIVGDLIAYGDVLPVWVGLLVQDLTPDLAAHFRGEYRGGVLIRGVESGSPAAEAGIQRGDVVVDIDGRPVTNTNEWETRLRDQSAGAELALTVVREQQKLVLRLNTRPFPMERADELAWELLGIRVRKGRPVEVVAVRRRSSAEQVGIRAGDAITALGGQPVEDVEAFRRKLVAHRNAQRVLVSVQRGRRVYHVPLPLGAAL